VKLLFDENLSPALVVHLANAFPESAHLRDVGLRGADDQSVWSFAAANGFMLVTKDDDFVEMSGLRGPPPKLVVIGVGNCTTAAVATLLLQSIERLRLFEADAVSSMIVLS
jgi:predicted nuclease of predicted toxin-antitoxin system